MLFRVLKNYIFFGIFFLSVSAIAVAETVKTAPIHAWPDQVTPAQIYFVSQELNQLADALLKKHGLRIDGLQQTLEQPVTPDVVFQLQLSIVELLHSYELKLNMRPIPIMIASPIVYYPADVKYIAGLIRERMQQIARSENISALPTLPLEKRKGDTTQDVFASMLNFYLKLNALNHTPTLTANEIFPQMRHANRELKNTVLHLLTRITDERIRRLLGTSVYGEDPFGGPAIEKAPEKITVRDLYRQCLVIRSLFAPKLQMVGIEPRRMPTEYAESRINYIDVFVQTQVILAEFNQWRRIIGVGTSSAVTRVYKNKTDQDVYQEGLSIEYILHRLSAIRIESKPNSVIAPFDE